VVSFCLALGMLEIGVMAHEVNHVMWNQPQHLRQCMFKVELHREHCLEFSGMRIHRRLVSKG
jgi:hypothetical protein